MKTRPTLLLALPLLLAATGCVSQADIKGSPCPCPDGFECCPTTATCIEPGGACPDTYPPSSQKDCLTDKDCAPNEGCHAWTTDSGDLNGPRQCRTMCTPDYPCADDEVCEPTLHDGAPMAQLEIAGMCLPVVPPAGCEEHKCSACSLTNLGTAWCDHELILGCFFALHPACGLSCTQSVVEDCSPKSCTMGIEGPGCMEEVDGPDSGPVEGASVDCSECDEIAPPGGFGCYEDGIATCWLANQWCSGCDQACVLEQTPCPGDTVCVEGETASCE